MCTVLQGKTVIDNKSKISIDGLSIHFTREADGECRFYMDVSDRDFDEFDIQVKDTVSYLSDNLDRIKALRVKVPDLQLRIDFGYNTLLIKEDLAWESLILPVDLIGLCHELNIEIVVSLYNSGSFNEDEETDEPAEST